MSIATAFEVRRASVTSPHRVGWEQEPWRSTPPLDLRHHMGGPPEHRPVVHARLLWDEAHLYAAFQVHDRFVLATAAAHQESVCIDSCVEFFFTPGERLETGYFNIECNCGGTILFHHQHGRRDREKVMPLELIREMEVHHSLPARVVPELTQPTTWFVSYRVPLPALSAYAPVTPPAPGVVWRANLYKCADNSSHPHWLTWSPVDLSRPDFHQSAFFGFLRFS